LWQNFDEASFCFKCQEKFGMLNRRVGRLTQLLQMTRVSLIPCSTIADNADIPSATNIQSRELK
jgi:hypothetical protein